MRKAYIAIGATRVLDAINSILASTSNWIATSQVDLRITAVTILTVNY